MASRRAPASPLTAYKGAHLVRETGRYKAMSNLGPVLYAARLADGTIKIGFTTHLGDRLHTLKHYNGTESVELLAFRPGAPEDERDLHEQLVAHRHHGREYYHPTPEVLAVVNDMRAGIGLPALEVAGT